MPVLGDQTSPVAQGVAFEDDEESQVVPTVEGVGVLDFHHVVAPVELDGGHAVESSGFILGFATGGRLVSGGKVLVAAAVTPIADRIVVGCELRRAPPRRSTTD